MTRPFTLQPLLELMQTRSDEATRRLGQLIAAEHNEKNRLQMLQQYREDYNQRFIASSQQGLSPLALRNFQDFLYRIDEAIAQQTEAVAASERHTAAGQNAWREQHRKLKAIDALAERHQEQERYRENRLDQKQQDEFASNKFRRDHPDPDTH
jgi:flagellar FliJ protein